MRLVKPPYPVRKLYSSLIWRFSVKEKILFLTFDDGPIPGLTPWILDLLKENNAKATFFCVGENVNKNPEIYARIVQEGHSVGNHTNNHLNGWKTKDSDYFENIDECSERVKSRLFRPPYGKIKRSQIKSIYLANQFRIIMWDVLSYDFDKGVTPEKCLYNVIRNSREGSVVVFHDNAKAEKNIKYALPKTLEYFLQKGYRFERIV